MNGSTSSDVGDGTSEESYPDDTVDTDGDNAVVKTLTHQQTGKKHIANYLVELSGNNQAIHCYCSYTLQTNPVEEEVDLEDDDLCQMCANGYVEDICKRHTDSAE